MRIRENPLFEKEIALEPEYQAGTFRVAEEVKRTAERIAPRGPTGMYHRSLGVLRVGGMLVVRTTDFAGHMVEWGSVNNETYAVIRRAAIQNDLKLVEIPKP